MFFFFSLLAKKKILEFLVFWFQKDSYILQSLLRLWLIGNRTSCRPIQSVIILVIKQIGLPRILLIIRMITDRTGLQSVLLPLLLMFLTTEKPHMVIASLRGRRLKGKGKGLLGARETWGAREEGGKETLSPSLRAPGVSLAPKTPFPFLFKRVPRRLGNNQQ